MADINWGDISVCCLVTRLHPAQPRPAPVELETNRREVSQSERMSLDYIYILGPFPGLMRLLALSHLSHETLREIVFMYICTILDKPIEALVKTTLQALFY